jgi:TonB-dependent SusC/RagA subfamily outer membrane receptor
VLHEADWSGLRRGRDPGERRLRGDPDGSPAAGPDPIVVRGPAHVAGGEPLIVVDGRVLQDNREADRIAPNQIERIDVLKGQAAVDRYGAPGANGVILITLKRAG